MMKYNLQICNYVNLSKIQLFPFVMTDPKRASKLPAHPAGKGDCVI